MVTFKAGAGAGVERNIFGSTTLKNFQLFFLQDLDPDPSGLMPFRNIDNEAIVICM
jgi:hypothetical protein